MCRVRQIHATVLAGTKLAEGAAAAGGQVGGSGWGTGSAAAGPACSGQAYFVTDGRPCSLQTFVDDVLQGLGADRSVRGTGRALTCCRVVGFGGDGRCGRGVLFCVDLHTHIQEQPFPPPLLPCFVSVRLQPQQ